MSSLMEHTKRAGRPAESFTESFPAPAQPGEPVDWEGLREPVTHDEAEKVARQFHEAYERLAPQFGYETRRASAVPWAAVPEQNKALMIAVAGEVIASRDARMKEPIEWEEWVNAIPAERARQITKGYDDAHDVQQGADHLIVWAVEYIRRGERVKAAAILDSVRKVLAARDARMKAEALEEAASDYFDQSIAFGFGDPTAVSGDWLRARAAEYREGQDA